MTENQDDLGRIVERYHQRRPINDIEARFFVEIVKAQPEIILKVRELALEAFAAGHRTYGMQGLFEVLRWSYLREPGRRTGINDHFAPYLRRWIAETTPELPLRFFQFRNTAIKRGGDQSELAVWMAVLAQMESEEKGDVA